MKQLTHESLRELLAERTGPRISVYLNPVRGPQQLHQNDAQLRSRLEQVTRELRQRYGKVEAKELTDRILQISQASGFWEKPMMGVGIFCAPDFLRVIPLRREVDEGVSVADNFYTKPLIRATQFSGRYQILCVSQRRVAVYEGNQDGLEVLGVKGLPANIIDALKAYNAESQTFNATPGSVDRTGGGNKDASDDMDTTRFFRVVDQAVWEHVSRSAKLPMILAAVGEYHHLFHEISANPYLLPQGIMLNPDSITDERLAEEAWKIIEPYYQREIEKMVDNFRLAQSKQLGSDDINQIAEAATFSRVSTLLVDANKQVGGKIDPMSGKVEFGPVDDPMLDDVLDDLAEAVLKNGGQVVVIPPEQMPTDSGAAAIYRY